ncbi:electron transfer flavoprotein subunit beta/FixA family protein [Chloroflexota bacterium]
MNIIVCVKRVPDITEAAGVVKIEESHKQIDKKNLVFKINEWDEFAVEEAVRLKEKSGGRVVAITVGPQEWDDVARKALAMGADEAIRIDEDVESADCYVVANILAKAIQQQSYDLIMFGAQSEDFGSAQLGPMVAESLGIPHATLIKHIELQNGGLKVSREIEEGMLELHTLSLPALLTIQTGINNPRYVSFVNIKRARDKQLSVLDIQSLSLAKEELTPKAMLERFDPPDVGKKAEVLSGSIEEVVDSLVGILKDAGVL